MTGIYCIENTANGNKYVGLAKDIAARFRHHRCLFRNGIHPNAHMQAAWDKYGEEAFQFYILEEVPKEKLRQAEMEWISNLNTFHNGYNMTAGGDGQHECYLTEAQKRHLSEINMGPRNPNYGLKRSAETRRKMSEAMSKPRGSMSEAHRKAISDSSKGKPHPWFNKPVLWVETGQVFASISEASAQTGYVMSSISSVCRGLRNSLYKQHFEFLEETK